jgi:hydrogenase maturation protease
MRSGSSETARPGREPARPSPQEGESILIVGVGNEYLCDEGLGVHVARSLLAMSDRLPAGVKVLEAGIFLMNSLGDLSRHRRVILVDAVRAGGSPGEVYRAELREGLAGSLPENPALSLHQWGVAESLRAAEILGLLPARLTLIGAEPARLEPGTDLSPALESARERIVSLLLEEVGA